MRIIYAAVLSVLLFTINSFAGITPWPFGKEIKFPWKSIQGSWQAVNVSSEANVFMFRMKTNAEGERQLEIILVDPYRCATVARGIGVLNGRYIAAQMVNKGQAFNLTIHAFNSSDVTGANTNTNLPYVQTTDKVVMAVSIFPIGDFDRRTSFEITKIGGIESPICN